MSIKTIEIKNLVDKLNIKLDTVEENVSKLKHGSAGVMQNIDQTKKRMKNKKEYQRGKTENI